jgi:hypothetical protein
MLGGGAVLWFGHLNTICSAEDAKAEIGKINSQIWTGLPNPVERWPNQGAKAAFEQGHVFSNPDSIPAQQQTATSTEFHDYESPWRRRIECETNLGDWIVALFTGVLGVFTILLAFATITAANAAKAAAELVPDLERAYVFVELEQIQFGGYSKGGAGGGEFLQTFARIRVTNYGKTPAILKEISADLVQKPEMIKPEFTEEVLDAPLILIGVADSVDVDASASFGRSGNDIRPPRAYKVITKSLPDELKGGPQHKAFTAGESFMWVSGKVIYDDVFGQEHETNFWLRNVAEKPAMKPHGGPKYQKRT